jgi:single-strand DNA-binding protein
MGVTLVIVGNVGGDPEMRYTPAGKAVTNFSLATNRKYKNAAGEQIEETTWWRCSAWEGRAEVLNQYLKKGMPLEVHGRLKNEIETYQKKDGSTGASYEVTVENFNFISGTGNGGGSYQSEQSEGASTQEPKAIPF